MTEGIVPQKRCTKCLKEFPRTFEFFYHSNRTKDGFYCQCKTCKESYRLTDKGKEVVRNRNNKWRTTEKGKQYLKAKEDRKKAKYPEKFAARRAVHEAVSRKLLEPISECGCARCDMQAQAYHHWSYEKKNWLDVIPLCRSCHNALHRMNKSNRLKLESRLLDTLKAA